MASPIRSAFEDRTALLPISATMPMRILNKDQKRSIKFKRISASIAEVGVIEPLVVSRLAGKDGSYLLLDGHARLSLLQEQGATEVRCLVALDDDPFTYNKRVSHLAIIQEHYMIMRALERGVTEKKIADALNVDVARIRRQRTLLDGICPEAVEMLKDRQLSPVVFGNLKKMASSRQIKVVGLMISCRNFSSSYAGALLAGTRQQDLAKPGKPKKVRGLSLEQMARMEHKMTTLEGDSELAESSYGDHMLELVIASGYLTKLLRNPQVERYLAEHHSEFLDQFRAIASSNVLVSLRNHIEANESVVIHSGCPIRRMALMWTNANRGRYDRRKLRYPSDLTDEEWSLVEPLIPPAKRGGNKRTVDDCG